MRVLSLEGRNLALFALAKLADSRDPDTGAHIERTRMFCKLLARGLHDRGLYPETVDHGFVELIEQTSPLHDIGKIGIPDSILLKPGRLSEVEFAVMKSHTKIGADTLTAAINEFPEARFLEMARDIAMSHHERWDGTGYPDGIAGDAIPLPARIMAIADVYDALRSTRVYKPAVDHDRTVEMILEGEGTHFDPGLIPVFREVATKFELAFEQWGSDGGDPVSHEMAA
ncbi:MAG: HD domain-containing phosphohydrolase [Planctomycetota bacterium]